MRKAGVKRSRQDTRSLREKARDRLNLGVVSTVVGALAFTGATGCSVTPSIPKGCTPSSSQDAFVDDGQDDLTRIPACEPSLEGIVDLNTGNAETARYAGVQKGAAFASGPVALSSDDIVQGRLGDCHFLSALGAIADERPELLANAITDNKDGSYQVRLFVNPLRRTITGGTDGGVAREVPLPGRLVEVSMRVVADFPVDPKTGEFIFAQALKGKDGKLKLWVALFEKAYAQHHGEWKDIQAGTGSHALETLTGKRSTFSTPRVSSVEKLKERLDEGQVILAGTFYERERLPVLRSKYFPGSSLSLAEFQQANVVPGHSYWIKDVDVNNQTVTLGNPHGKDKGTTVSWPVFKKLFASTVFNKLP